MLSGCATYRAGVALPDTDTPVAALGAASAGRMVWISLHDPSEEECQRLSAILHLGQDLTMALADGRPRARLRSIAGILVLHAAAARYDPVQDLVDIGSMTALMGDGLLVTVTRHTPTAVTELRRRLEGMEGALSQGTGHVVWHLVEAIVSGYGEVLGDLRADVEVAEREAFGSPATGGPITQRIYRLKREALDFQQASAALIDPLEDLGTDRYTIPGDHGVPDWKSISDRLTRLVDRAASVNDLLNGILAAYQTEVALKQNEDMRRISAWVAIAAVPTLLAGVYGMNFANMPELQWRYGYPVLLIVMASVCVGLYLAFRRRDWL